MEHIRSLIQQLYPQHADSIFEEVTGYMKTVPKLEGTSDRSFWYKNINLYIIYPDGLYSKKLKPFQRLIPHLDYVKDMGFNAVHILPFLASPMVDKGFDISDFNTVRAELGTMNDLKKFKKAADEKGIRVFMDLVFNHISDHHEWFQKAENGDAHYRNYFIHCKEKPTYIRTVHKDSAVWAEYMVEGKKILTNIAFPEYVGEVPLWRQGKDGYWYYHTYYPQQLDVNWANPQIFIEFAKIVMNWASLGFHFRMDAIPFVGKGAYKQTDDDNDVTFKIIAALNAIADEIYPECAFIVETYEKIGTVIDYFGTSNVKQAELSYNFHLTTYLWVGLVMRDASYIWQKLDQMFTIPKHAEWINFLRNHDELSLAHLPDDLVANINKELLPHGAPFRQQYGISGRTFSLFNKRLKRFLMAYFLLASIPGSMGIVYGDEFGVENVPIHRLPEHERKDSRNINRGVITKHQMKTVRSRKIHGLMKQMLHKRAILREYQNIIPERLESIKDSAIFAARYQMGASELLIYINLSDTNKTIQGDVTEYKNIADVNAVTVAAEKVELGPYAGVWLEK